MNKFIFLMATSLVGFSINLSAKVVDKVVAIVNDEPITLSDVDKFRKRLSAGGLVDDALLKLTDSQQLLKDKNSLLNYLIDEKLVDSEVKRKNMEVPIERVEQEIRNITKTNGISRDQLKDALKAKGVSMAQYQDYMRTSLERQGLLEREVTSKIRISDEDVSSYYLSKKGPSASQIFEYNISHILFLPKNGGEQGALSRAKSVEEKIRAGQSFEKLAEQYSEDPNFTKGGSLGAFKAGEMVKEFENAIRNLGPGEVSSPIETAQGYHIIKVNKRTLISDPRFEEEKEDLRRVLFAEAYKRQFRLWLNQRRDDAFIKINGF